MKEKLLEVEIALIDEPAELDRSHIDDELIIELACSIRERGLLMPVRLRQNGTRYVRESGRRRILACKMLKRRKITAIVLPEGKEGERIDRFMENVQRENLNAVDEGRQLSKIMDEEGWNIAEAAKKLGKSESWIRSRIDIIRADNEIQESVALKQISLGVGVELGRIEDQKFRKIYLDYAKAGGCTVDQAKRWRAEYQGQTGQFDIDPETGATIFPESIYEITLRCEFCGDTVKAIDQRVVRSCPGCVEIIKGALRDAPAV